MPIISVVVPVYKVESFIHRCVDSILGQSFQEFELILVDDGSPDNSGIICDEYAKKDNRIHVVHKKNGGLSDARNAGIEWVFSNSDCQWITFIDSDDWIHPRYLELLYYSAINYNCSISICSFLETDRCVPFCDVSDSTPRLVTPEYFFCEKNVVAIVAWGKLYKKELFGLVRYPKGKINEDEYVTYKLLFMFSNIVFIDTPLYYYYRNQSSIMNSPWNTKRLDIIEAFSERNSFFKKMHYENALRYGVNQILVFIKWYVDILITNDEYSDNRMTYYKYLRKHLRIALRMGRYLRICKVKDNPFLYEFAYPRLFRVYTFIKSLKRQ